MGCIYYNSKNKILFVYPVKLISCYGRPIKRKEGTISAQNIKNDYKCRNFIEGMNYIAIEYEPAHALD